MRGLFTLLGRLAAWFRAVAAESQQPCLASKIRDLLPDQERCALCRVHVKAERDAISALAGRFAADKTAALSSLSALCFPHFARLASLTPDAKLVRRLIEHQATIFEQVSEDMQRYALKHDATRRYLENQEEATAAERALLLIAGHRNVNAARTDN